jgi:hypothetical protein
MEGYAVGVEHSQNTAQQAVRNALIPDVGQLAALAALSSSAGLAVAGGTTRQGDTFNFNGERRFSLADLQAMLDRRDALERVGRQD